MTLLNDLTLAARIAVRDMRGGARSLWLLVAGVFVGAAAVALVGAVSTSLIDASRQGAVQAVGGDLSLRLFHRPPSDTELAVLRRQGEVAVTAELRPMARALHAATGDTGAAHLIELKGVDMDYPLYGEVKVRPSFSLYENLNQQGGVYGAVADQALFDALDVELGDSLLIGDAQYQLRGVLVAEPDRAFRAFTLGPRVMVLNESFPAAAIADEGAEVYFYARIRLPEGQRTADDARAALDRIDLAFPDAGWRMVNAHDGVPGLERTLAMAHVLLLFIGLGVMLIGGAGISGAMRAHIAAKMEVAAILKSIGTPPNVIALALGLQAMAAATAGAVLGVALGAFGPVLAAGALADQLPFVLDTVPAAKPLAAAALFGMLVAALFAWWPLMGVRDVSARVLLRERIDHIPVRASRAVWLGAGTLCVLIAAVVFWASPMPVLTGAFLIGALALAVFFLSLGKGVARAAKVLARGRSAGLRLGLGGLYRAGAPTGSVVMALGLTLTVLVVLDGIGQAARGHVARVLPDRAPDLVAFSLSAATAGRMQAEAEATGLIERRRAMPFLHARVQAIRGVPVQELKIPGSLGWVVRGDRGVSFSENPPAGGDIVQGEWWTAMEARGTAFSLDADVARKLRLEPGDEISLNVLGRVVTGPIKNLRRVDWTGLDLDFPIIATPGALEGVPHTFAAALKAPPGQAVALETFLKARFPDVPLIRVADVLASLRQALDVVVTGLSVAAWMCGLGALVVLTGSVLQGLGPRLDEAVLFKVLGARRAQLLRQLAVEFAALGVVVALVAVPLGLGVAFAAARAAGLDGGAVPVVGALTLAVLGIAVTVGVGLAVTVGTYTAAPARVLRRRGV